MDSQIEDIKMRICSYLDQNGAGSDPYLTEIPGLSLVRTSQPAFNGHLIYDPVFCLVLQGEKLVVVGEKQLRFSKMESLIVSLSLPATSAITAASSHAPYIAIATRLDLNLVRELSETTEISYARKTSSAAQTLTADGEILDAMRRLVGLLDRSEARSVLHPLIEREIHFWLLASEHGSFLRGLAKLGGRGERVARAIRVIRDHFNETLRIKHLADVAGMSTSAFHVHFHEVTGFSPLQYQKQLRLSEGKRLMKTGDYSVSSVAFKIGYESPTQFSREYARTFGASPTKDPDLFQIRA